MRRVEFGSAVVEFDHDQTGMRAFQHAARAVDRRLDLDRGGEAEKQNVAAARDLGRALSFLGAALDQVVDRRAVAMAHDGERMTLLEDVLGRAVAHQPDADVANPRLAHLLSPISGQ